jgi:hypothetical protein
MRAKRTRSLTALAGALLLTLFVAGCTGCDGGGGSGGSSGMCHGTLFKF